MSQISVRQEVFNFMDSNPKAKPKKVRSKFPNYNEGSVNQYIKQWRKLQKGKSELRLSNGNITKNKTSKNGNKSVVNKGEIIEENVYKHQTLILLKTFPYLPLYFKFETIKLTSVINEENKVEYGEDDSITHFQTTEYLYEIIDQLKLGRGEEVKRLIKFSGDIDNWLKGFYSYIASDLPYNKIKKVEDIEFVDEMVEWEIENCLTFRDNILEEYKDLFQFNNKKKPNKREIELKYKQFEYNFRKHILRDLYIFSNQIRNNKDQLIKELTQLCLFYNMVFPESISINDLIEEVNQLREEEEQLPLI